MYDFRKIMTSQDAYYKDKLEQYGVTSRGVDWNSEEGQRLRYVQLSNVIQDKEQEAAICDFGCGYGYYRQYLKEQNYPVRYTGIDLCSEMIEHCNRIYAADENCDFIQGTEFPKSYDYIVTSGIFNLKLQEDTEAWKDYVLDTIEKFNQYSKKGFAFNCLTKYSDKEYMRDDLYYGDPLFYFDYCKTRFSRNVDLLHGYNLYEFTIIVKK